MHLVQYAWCVVYSNPHPSIALQSSVEPQQYVQSRCRTHSHHTRNTESCHKLSQLLKQIHIPGVHNKNELVVNYHVCAASKITALATCALSHHFQNVYNSLSSTLIYTTSISKFNANSNKKFQTATLDQ